MSDSVSFWLARGDKNQLGEVEQSQSQLDLPENELEQVHLFLCLLHVFVFFDACFLLHFFVYCICLSVDFVCLLYLFVYSICLSIAFVCLLYLFVYRICLPLSLSFLESSFNRWTMDPGRFDGSHTHI